MTNLFETRRTHVVEVCGAVRAVRVLVVDAERYCKHLNLGLQHRRTACLYASAFSLVVAQAGRSEGDISNPSCGSSCFAISFRSDSNTSNPRWASFQVNATSQRQEL